MTPPLGRSGVSWLSTHADRIVAVVAGVCLTAAYLLVDPFAFASDAFAAALSGIPVTLLLYGISGASRRSAVVIGGASTLGLAPGTSLRTAGTAV